MTKSDFLEFLEYEITTLGDSLREHNRQSWVAGGASLTIAGIAFNYLDSILSTFSAAYIPVFIFGTASCVICIFSFYTAMVNPFHKEEVHIQKIKKIGGLKPRFIYISILWLVGFSYIFSQYLLTQQAPYSPSVAFVELINFYIACAVLSLGYRKYYGESIDKYYLQPLLISFGRLSNEQQKDLLGYIAIYLFFSNSWALFIIFQQIMDTANSIKPFAIILTLSIAFLLALISLNHTIADLNLALLRNIKRRLLKNEISVKEALQLHTKSFQGLSLKEYVEEESQAISELTKKFCANTEKLESPSRKNLKKLLRLEQKIIDMRLDLIRDLIVISVAGAPPFKTEAEALQKKQTELAQKESKQRQDAYNLFCKKPAK